MNCPHCQEKIAPDYSATGCPYCGMNFSAPPILSAKTQAPVAAKIKMRPLLVLLFSPATLTMILALFQSPELTGLGIFIGCPLAGSIAGIVLARKAARNSVERIVLAVVLTGALTMACLVSCFPGCALVMGRHITGG